MESRERVLRAINMGRPDRPPISHAILPSAQYYYGDALKRVTDAVPEDFGWSLLLDLPPEKLPPLYKEGEHRDEFGTLRVLEDAAQLGLIDLPSVLARLRQTTFRAAPTLIRALLDRDAERKKKPRP
jgi:hypothetical protein